jgi:hypothetical protein
MLFAGGKTVRVRPVARRNEQECSIALAKHNEREERTWIPWPARTDQGKEVLFGRRWL